jgi:hypothetical protein
MVTHSTTNLPVSGLSMGEQTGPRILHYLWSYVLDDSFNQLIYLPAREFSSELSLPDLYHIHLFR